MAYIKEIDGHNLRLPTRGEIQQIRNKILDIRKLCPDQYTEFNQFRQIKSWLAGLYDLTLVPNMTGDFKKWHTFIESAIGLMVEVELMNWDSSWLDSVYETIDEIVSNHYT